MYLYSQTVQEKFFSHQIQAFYMAYFCSDKSAKDMVRKKIREENTKEGGTNDDFTQKLDKILRNMTYF